MSLTAAQCQAQLEAWLAADMAVSKGQKIRMDDGSELTRADAATISAKIDFWSNKLAAAKRSGGSISVGYAR